MKKIEFGILANKQIKELVLVLISGLVIIILDFSFLIKLQWRDVLSLKHELSQTREKVTASALAGFSSEQLKERLAQLSESVVDKREGTLKEEEIPNLLGEISNLADKSDLKIMRMTPQEGIHDRDKYTTSAQEYYTVPISLITRGPYHSLGKFLNYLEKSRYFIKINTINIIPQKQSLLNPEHDIKLSISIFVVREI